MHNFCLFCVLLCFDFILFLFSMHNQGIFPFGALMNGGLKTESTISVQYEMCLFSLKNKNHIFMT